MSCPNHQVREEHKVRAVMLGLKLKDCLNLDYTD
ncbi:hypothetical protein M2133_001250 [Parabacteroides sp. PF5-6]|nr:hypothetical protein [Parabacteroides sp. PF5-6]